MFKVYQYEIHWKTSNQARRSKMKSKTLVGSFSTLAEAQKFSQGKDRTFIQLPKSEFEAYAA